MELKFSITREDFWQFSKFYFERRGSFRRAAIVFSVVAALTGLILRLNGKLPWWALLSIVVVAAALRPTVRSVLSMALQTERYAALV